MAGSCGKSPDGQEVSARVISSYAEAKAVLLSLAARVPADTPPPLPAGGGAGDALVRRGVELRALWMWGGVPDQAPARRKAGAAAIGPASVGRIDPYVRSRAAALLDGPSRSEEVDLVAGFVRPLVRDALMELLGVDPAARTDLDGLVGAMAGFLPGRRPSAGRYLALAATAARLEQIWAKPLPPLAEASRVLRDAVAAGELSHDEALAQATLLLFGNSYTTVDAFAGLLARLAERPHDWRAARSGAAPIASLFEESLRLGPPSQLVLLRDAAADIVCPGGAIKKGSRIVLPLDRLNRDPDRFPRPDAFQAGRAGPAHLAFGMGRHMCIGLHLARSVVRIGVEALLLRLPAWPAQTLVGEAPSLLGGASVSRIVLPPGALRPC